MTQPKAKPPKADRGTQTEAKQSEDQCTQTDVPDPDKARSGDPHKERVRMQEDRDRPELVTEAKVLNDQPGKVEASTHETSTIDM
jgi:hypothetical protein